MACKMSSKVYQRSVTLQENLKILYTIHKLWHGSSYTEYIAVLDNTYSFVESLHFLIFPYVSEIFLNFNPHSWNKTYVC